MGSSNSINTNSRPTLLDGFIEKMADKKAEKAAAERRASRQAQVAQIEKDLAYCEPDDEQFSCLQPDAHTNPFAMREAALAAREGRATTPAPVTPPQTTPQASTTYVANSSSVQSVTNRTHTGSRGMGSGIFSIRIPAHSDTPTVDSTSTLPEELSDAQINELIQFQPLTAADLAAMAISPEESEEYSDEGDAILDSVSDTGFTSLLDMAEAVEPLSFNVTQEGNQMTISTVFNVEGADGDKEETETVTLYAGTAADLLDMISTTSYDDLLGVFYSKKNVMKLLVILEDANLGNMNFTDSLKSNPELKERYLDYITADPTIL